MGDTDSGTQPPSTAQYGDRQQGSSWVPSFTGVAAAVVTPFHADGTLALELVPDYVNHLHERGAGALMVAGTTGEFITMSEDERGAVIETFISANGGRIPLIAHVGDANPAVATRLAARAAADGADALAAILPYFHPTQPDSVRESLTRLAQSQPQLPFLPYCHPSTINHLGADQFARMRADLPQVSGAKLSLGTFAEMKPYLSNDPEATFFCGNDDVLAEFVDAGGHAIVSGNAAVFCEIVSAALRALLDQQHATMDRLGPLIAEIVQLTRSGAPDRLKALLRERGLDAGHARVVTSPDALVPPPLSPALRDALQP
jgi:dihydrodipicolinate synthase/N-acetylneuraminate lyase